MEELWVDNGDIRLRVEVTGEGPTIVFVSGFPELPQSWRHQVAHVVDRGYRAAALEVRGYGASSHPPEVERYTLKELASDVAAVIAALGDEPVVLVGHDWGAPIVWHTAVRHPEKVRAVAGLSVPYTPPLGISLIDVFEQVYADRFFYMLHFQTPGVAEAELLDAGRGALKTMYWAMSGEAPANLMFADAPRESGFLELFPDPPHGPLSWITEDEIDAAYERLAMGGLTGPLNRYRALALDATVDADIVGVPVTQPACFIGGEADPVRAMLPGNDLYADAGAACSDFRGTTLVQGAGHWVQQERPAEVNAALDRFLDGL